MKRLYYITISLMILISGCKLQDNQYDAFVRKITKYQNAIEIEYSENYAFIDTTTFNINYYFSLYDKLKLDSNFTLDYYYFNIGGDGRPLLFALKHTEDLDSIIKRFEKYSSPPHPTIPRVNFVSPEIISYANDEFNPIARIHIEDNEMGYFQYVIFYLIGDNFSLSWHSNYGKLLLINSEKAIFELLSYDSDFTDFSKEQKKKIKTLSPEPNISLTKDSCYISILGFNAWEGFVRTKFSINRDYPHKVTYISRDTLVKHDCRVLF